MSREKRITLEFTRESIILNGFPVLGTTTVEVTFERDPYDGLYEVDIEATDWEPEIPVPGLQWADVEAQCDAWLAANRVRIEKRALWG